MGFVTFYSKFSVDEALIVCQVRRSTSRERATRGTFRLPTHVEDGQHAHAEYCCTFYDNHVGHHDRHSRRTRAIRSRPTRCGARRR